MVAFLAASLAGCAGGGRYLPWGSGEATSVFTDDPNIIPNISWQTPDQRQVLVEQNAAMSEDASAVLPEAQPGIEVQPAPAAPVIAALPSAKKVTVSLLLPLTGKKEALGQSMLKAAQMALFDIGSANFELVPRDTKSTVAGAAAAAEAAVHENDALILGPIFAEDLKAVKPIASASRIPVISFTTDWTLAGDNTYIMGFLPFTQVTRVVKFAQDKGYSKLAVYAPQTEYCDVVIRTLQKTDVSIVRVNRYSPQQLDLSALVKDFAETSRQPDGSFDFNMLMLPLGSEGLRSLVNVLETNGIDQSKVKFIGTGLWDDTVLMNSGSLKGGWFAAPDPRLRADFEKRFQQNYETVPLRLSSLAYDATALAAVLARAPQEGGRGGPGPYGQEALTNPRGFAGIDGIFRFRPDGLSERGLAVLEIQPDRPKVIDPAPTAFILSGS